MPYAWQNGDTKAHKCVLRGGRDTRTYRQKRQRKDNAYEVHMRLYQAHER